MFREYIDIINESVNEGANRGVQLFLESLNQDLVLEEVCEELGGTEAAIKQIFVENGYEITEIDEKVELQEAEVDAEVLEEEAFDAKLDEVLEQLKKEGIVD